MAISEYTLSHGTPIGIACIQDEERVVGEPQKAVGQALFLPEGAEQERIPSSTDYTPLFGYTGGKLNHAIFDAEGANILLKGSKDDAAITLETRSGPIDADILAPDDTIFLVHSYPEQTYFNWPGTKSVWIPKKGNIPPHPPAFCLFHEIGHVWEVENGGWWARDIVMAYASVMVGLGRMSEKDLGSTYEVLRSRLKAGKNVLQSDAQNLHLSEFFASSCAIYTWGKMKRIGKDPFPMLEVGNLAEPLNHAIRLHPWTEIIKPTKLFTSKMIREILHGDFPEGPLKDFFPKELDRRMSGV